MNNLQLIKSENFGTAQCDFYGNGNNEFFMTREQIGRALEYSNHSDAIRKIHDRHKERLDKFSVEDKLSGTDGKKYQTYLYTRKGIMEICRWSQQPCADAFMDWVWEIMDSLINGNGVLASTVKSNEVTARLKNAQARKASLYVKMANNSALSLKYKQVLLSYATKELNGGQAVLPLPETKRGYSAAEIGEMFGLSANKIGRIANQHNLKVDGLGELRKDKSKSSLREVDTWVYFDTAIPIFEKILNKKSA